MNEVTPFLRNRRTGIIVRYNPITATHPDMVLCDEMPGEKKTRKPRRKKAAMPEPAAAPETGAEINDLLAGIDNG